MDRDKCNEIPQVSTPRTEGNLTTGSDRVKAPMAGAGLTDFGGGHSGMEVGHLASVALKAPSERSCNNAEMMRTHTATAFLSQPLVQLTISRDTAIGLEDGKLGELQELLTETIRLIKSKRTVPTEVTNNVKEALALIVEALNHRKSWKDEQRKLTLAEARECEVLRQAATPCTPTSKRPASSPPLGPEEDTRTGDKGGFTLVNRKKKKRTGTPTPPKATQQSTSGPPNTQASAPAHRKAKRKKATAPGPRANAVLIKPAHQATIRSIRETRDGDILLEMGRKSDNCPSFTDAIKVAVGERGSVKSLSLTHTIEIRDIDSSTDKADIRDALVRDLDDTADIKRIGLSKNAFQGQRTAFIVLDGKSAQKILASGRIKIGWVICRTRRHESIQRCYRCLGYGYLSNRCTGPDRSKLCYKCGEADHKAAACSCPPRCILCAATEGEGLDTDHVPGAGRCATYRSALKGASTGQR